LSSSPPKRRPSAELVERLNALVDELITENRKLERKVEAATPRRKKASSSRVTKRAKKSTPKKRATAKSGKRKPVKKAVRRTAKASKGPTKKRRR
jgi:hypothetical protein